MDDERDWRAYAEFTRRLLWSGGVTVPARFIRSMEPDEFPMLQWASIKPEGSV